MTKNSELQHFYNSASNEMKEEYERIRNKSAEDPGTAGDEGEENWRKLLNDWLPSNYHVVTKGRILRPDGTSSRQMDVLVLSPSYPKKLLYIGTKQYLSGGVIAAFECKLTLKREHIVQSMKRCAEIKSISDEEVSTPHRELNAPIIYGLLSHSHDWNAPGSDPAGNIQRALFDGLAECSHPREILDVVCVADFMAWTAVKGITLISPDAARSPEVSERFKKIAGDDGDIWSKYYVHEKNKCLGALVNQIIYLMAWRDSQLRYLSEYYKTAELGKSQFSIIKPWARSVFAEEMRGRRNEAAWSEWRLPGLANL